MTGRQMLAKVLLWWWVIVLGVAVIANPLICVLALYERNWFGALQFGVLSIVSTLVARATWRDLRRRH